MISYSAALELILQCALTLKEEKVKLSEATGRFLSKPVLADRDYPPFNRATMDGYAIETRSFEKSRQYRVSKWLNAGEKIDYDGECIGISTGAAVPEKFDAIIRIEDAIRDSENEDHQVKFNIDSVRPFLNIAKRGEDISDRGVLAEKGQQINPGTVSALASAGAVNPSVFVMPRVRIVSCGNEVIRTDGIPQPHQIRDSNSQTVNSFLRAMHITPADLNLASDDPRELQNALAAGLDSDILIVTGGVSKGPRDHVAELLKKLTVIGLFHGVAIRPGKPLFFGKHERGVVFAFPGNPLSVLVGCEVFLKPFLLKCEGALFYSMVSIFQGERKRKANLDEFFPIEWDSNGIRPASWNGSGDISIGVKSAGIAHHPAEVESLHPGNTVRFYPWTV